jgi:hypothetical protein
MILTGETAVLRVNPLALPLCTQTIYVLAWDVGMLFRVFGEHWTERFFNIFYNYLSDINFSRRTPK